jgi:hypothetical protein
MTREHFEGQEVEVDVAMASPPQWRKAKIVAIHRSKRGLQDSFAIQFPNGVGSYFLLGHIRGSWVN